MKQCSKCKEIKEFTEFTKRSDRPSGLNSKCKTCHNISNIKSRKRKPHKIKMYQLKQKYGISIDLYNQMLITQNNLCASCELPETNTYRGKLRSLAVDHCHITGKVRALLCNGCNSAEGHLRGSSERARKLADYMDKHRSIILEQPNSLNQNEHS